MPGGAQGPLGMLRASQMVQQLLPGGHVPYMPQPEEEKKPQFITELEINDFPQHARWKVRLLPLLWLLLTLAVAALQCHQAARLLSVTVHVRLTFNFSLYL